MCGMASIDLIKYIPLPLPPPPPPPPPLLPPPPPPPLPPASDAWFVPNIIVASIAWPCEFVREQSVMDSDDPKAAAGSKCGEDARSLSFESRVCE